MITKNFHCNYYFSAYRRGQTALDTKLSTFYPHIKYADVITIGNHLNHTSGLYDYLEWEDYYHKKSSTYTRDHILKLIGQGKTQIQVRKREFLQQFKLCTSGFHYRRYHKKKYADNGQS